MAGEFLRAKQGGSFTDSNGVMQVIRKGSTYGHGHPITKRMAELFVPFEPDYPWEPEIKAEKKRRGRPPKVRA